MGKINFTHGIAKASQFRRGKLRQKAISKHSKNVSVWRKRKKWGRGCLEYKSTGGRQGLRVETASH